MNNDLFDLDIQIQKGDGTVNPNNTYFYTCSPNTAFCYTNTCAATMYSCNSYCDFPE